MSSKWNTGESPETQTKVWHSFGNRTKYLSILHIWIEFGTFVTQISWGGVKSWHIAYSAGIADLAVGQIQYSDQFTRLWLFTGNSFSSTGNRQQYKYSKVKTHYMSTVQCHGRGYLKWEEQQWQHTAIVEESMLFCRCRTFVHQSSLSCCSSPALPLSCLRCSDDMQRRTIYLLSKLLLRPPRLLLPPSRERYDRPLESESGSHQRSPLPCRTLMWSYEKKTLERTLWSLLVPLWTAQDHTGKHRGWGWYSM